MPFGHAETKNLLTVYLIKIYNRFVLLQLAIENRFVLLEVVLD